MSRPVVIAHLYPREMNIYGDMGNVMALRRRLEWRGYEAVVRPVEVGEKFDFEAADLIFGGGGQDSGQLLVGADLEARGLDIRTAVEGGLPALVICGLYQLFGRGFTTLDGHEIPGIDVFKVSTVGSRVRMVGNITVESERFGRLVGFENHSGQTLLEAGQASLGRVTRGFGNDDKSRREGAVSYNAVGTYLHGPILPKNPALADWLILEAVRRRYGVTELQPLDDTIEQAAARSASARPQ